MTKLSFYKCPDCDLAAAGSKSPNVHFHLHNSRFLEVHSPADPNSPIADFTLYCSHCQCLTHNKHLDDPACHHCGRFWTTINIPDTYL